MFLEEFHTFSGNDFIKFHLAIPSKINLSSSACKLPPIKTISHIITYKINRELKARLNYALSCHLQLMQTDKIYEN